MAARTLASQLRYVEDAHDLLGLTYRQLAAALGADESTLHRWRSGDSAPRSIFLSRMDALREMQQELLEAKRGCRARVAAGTRARAGRPPPRRPAGGGPDRAADAPADWPESRNVHLTWDGGSRDGPAEWGVSADALSSDDWTECQRAARDARLRGYEAIRFPSATGAGENLALFLDRLVPGSYVRILREEELRPTLT